MSLKRKKKEKKKSAMNKYVTPYKKKKKILNAFQHFTKESMETSRQTARNRRQILNIVTDSCAEAANHGAGL